MRGLLQAIDELGEGDRSRLRAALVRHELEQIEKGASAWQPVALLVTWMDTIDAIVGRRRFLELFASFAKMEIQGSILRSFVAGALRIFGPGGSTLARRIPTGMSLMYRDLGQISDARVNASEHLIIIDDLPAICSDSLSYVPGVAAYFQGLFDALGVQGNASVRHHDRVSRRVVFHFVWT